MILLEKKNKKNLKNYVEIFIDSDINKIIEFKKKDIYKKKKNLMGVHIAAQFPKKPDIIIKNDLKTKKNKLKSMLIKKILKHIKK